MNPHIKPGSEDDVAAIGTRNIGGRGLGNWFSTDWEIRTGKQYSMEIEKSAHLVTDPVIVEYVNRIGQNLVKNSDAKVPFTIKVIDSDEINAMALPGGFFYVNSGLILACDEESELAGVMAHEISHVVAHHAARQQTKMMYAEIGSIPLMIMTEGTWTGYGIYEATQLAIPMTFLKFSRMDESEADYLGVQYMYKAGYDPQSFVTMFEKLDSLEKHKPGTLARAFSDHPATGSRIDAAEDEIATILPAKPDYVVTTSEFDDVKARLARLENKRKVNGKDNGNKPTLRRAGATTTNPNSNNPADSGSDQPTLGRRN
jgi:predicted Zn-dependent protease